MLQVKGELASGVNKLSRVVIVNKINFVKTTLPK